MKVVAAAFIYKYPNENTKLETFILKALAAFCNV